MVGGGEWKIAVAIDKWRQNRSYTHLYVLWRQIRKPGETVFTFHTSAEQRLSLLLPKDGGSLQHFCHEGRYPFQLTISSSNSSQDAINNSHFCRVTWHKTANLGHKNNHPSLSYVSWFSSHVWPCRASISQKLNTVAQENKWSLSVRILLVTHIHDPNADSSKRTYFPSN